MCVHLYVDDITWCTDICMYICKNVHVQLPERVLSDLLMSQMACSYWTLDLHKRQYIYVSMLKCICAYIYVIMKSDRKRGRKVEKNISGVSSLTHAYKEKQRRREIQSRSAVKKWRTLVLIGNNRTQMLSSRDIKKLQAADLKRTTISFIRNLKLVKWRHQDCVRKCHTPRPLFPWVLWRL